MILGRVVDASGEIECWIEWASPAALHEVEGRTWQPLAAPFTRPASPTAIVVYEGGAAVVVETAPLEARKAAAVDQCYDDVDAVYRSAIGQRATVYKRAEEASRAYAAAEVKPSPVSNLIADYARSNPTGVQQTDAWAVQQIIERADAFLWAEDQMRGVMFDRHVDMRAATTAGELAAAVTAWTDFIAWLRATLQLPEVK